MSAPVHPLVSTGNQEKVLIEINVADSIAGLVELCTVGYALLTHRLHASAHLLPPIN